MCASSATTTSIHVGSGKRISIKDTRAIIDAILDGSIEDSDSKVLPLFNFEIPTSLPNVDTGILDPRDTYPDAGEWQTRADNLAALFIDNFTQYTDTDSGKALLAAGPQQ